MIKKDRYSQRLLEEWKKHGKVIIGVDYDSTITPFKGEVPIDNRADIDRCISLLKQCQSTGCYTVIHTSCNNDRYEGIREDCTEKGIRVSSINENPVKLPFGHQSKPYCNIYLDDRAGFSEAMDILESALYQYRGHLQSQNKLDEIA